MELLLKGLIGAAIVVVVDLLAHNKNFHLAGLVLLFPALTLIGHWLIAQARGTQALQETAVFGALSLIPYAIYLAGVYFLAPRVPVLTALGIAVGGWLVSALVLVIAWRR